MEQGSSPFTGSLARVTRTRSMETVVAVPLPPQSQLEVDELRMQSVERAAASSSQFNQMTYEQLAQFHAQQEAMAKRLEDESSRQLSMAAAMETNRREQEESRAILLRQQEELVRQQEELKRAMAEQARVSEAHQDMLRQASDAMRQQHYKVEELNQKVRRDSERWGLFAEATNQRAAFTTGRAPEAPRLENLMGVQQVPMAPTYKGSTKRERREFMDEYLAYSRRVEVLNRGMGGTLFLMPLAACIDQKIVPRVCAHDFGKSFEDITENDWRDYFLSAREVQELDLDAVTKAMASLKMDTKIRDAESRVGRLLADFYEKLEQLDVAHLPEQEPKQSVKILTAAIRPPQLKATVERQLMRETNKAYKSDVRSFCRWLVTLMDNFMLFESQLLVADKKPDQPPPKQYGDRAKRFLPPKKNDGGAPAKTPPPTAAATSNGKGCLKCGSDDHRVFKCPKVQPGEAQRLLDQRFKKPNVAAVAAPDKKDDAKRKIIGAAVDVREEVVFDCPRTVACDVNGVTALALLDSGADQSVVSPAFLARVESADNRKLVVRQLDRSIELGGFMEAMKLTVDREVKLRLTFDTAEGTLVLANLKCWVAATPLQDGLGDVIVSRDVMARLGYCPHSLLARARRAQSVYDLNQLGDKETPLIAAMKVVETMDKPTSSPEEASLYPEEERACFPDVQSGRSMDIDRLAVRAKLEEKVGDCKAAGCGDNYARQLLELLVRYEDVFRLSLGRDPPVDVAPLVVTLKQGAEPVRCKARRYSKEQRDFMAKHVAELEAAGLCYRNPRSKWCSAPLIVKKPDANDFRMTVDVRPVNAQTERILWPMPMLEVILDHLAGAEVFFTLDFFKGYWQFALDKASQEMFSFLTDTGVYTPTRVLMGGTDSVAYCQSSVQEMFESELYKSLLIWLDDLLGYEKSKAGLLAALERVLVICQERGLKLNPKKCRFYESEARWCGRIVSSDGVKHDPERIKALQELKMPVTGQDLQQFLCAMNWMRMSIPRYNVIVQPITDLLESVYKAAGGRTRQKVAKVLLAEVGWDADHATCLEQCKEALSQVVTLAHPKPDRLVCVFADASDLHWGGVVTQIPRDQVDRELDSQDHEPLMFLSGTFSGAAQRWAIVEKEAFSIVECLKRADYLLHKPGGFALFTDHANLKFIFNPASVNAAIPKYTAAKLDRWALLLMGYDYTIYDISGDVNVWADLLSRWGAKPNLVCPIVHVPLKISPLRSKDFVWPSMSEVLDEQVKAVGRGDFPDVEWTVDQVEIDGGQVPLLKTSKGAAWIPTSASDLQVRLCVVAHFGVGGHRGITATKQVLGERFWWSDMASDVAYFVGRCLHCASTGGHVLRPFGATVHATKPNEILHWDFLFMDGGYILVAKDDFSQFKWLWETDVANAQVVARCLQQWFSVFGVCYHWVSDQGSHFKNEVIAELQHLLGAHHHFTTARCPWANGTVESAMKTTLKTFRALLSEWLMQPNQWRLIVPVVMLVLNQSPSETLGGTAPITAMTGGRAMSPLDRIALPGPTKTTTLDELWSLRQDELKSLVLSLDSMHEKIGEASSKKRRKNRDLRLKKKGVEMAQFDVGDFVLYMDVWSMTHSKLSVTWRGPAQVVKTISDWIFEIQNLVTGVVREAHSSRLKFYADDSLEVSEELLRHVAHNADGHVVDDFVDCRYNDRLAAYEVLVSWRGLQDIENSWEPASNLLEDIPVAFKKYVQGNGQDPVVMAMATALGVRQALGGIVANSPFAEPLDPSQEAVQESCSLG